MATDSSGIDWCPICGRYFCGGWCEEKDMSMRSKPSFKPFEAESLFVDTERPTPTAKELGRAAAFDDLLGYLAGYMQDESFAKTFASCIDLIRKKNADYSQGEQKGDRIAAFRRIGRDIDVPMEKVWAIFAQKHWGAVMKYVKDGSVESEPIQGRIADLINYFVLLAAIVEDDK